MNAHDNERGCVCMHGCVSMHICVYMGLGGRGNNVVEQRVYYVACG